MKYMKERPSEEWSELIAALIYEILVLPFIVMLIWNAIIPEIFGLTEIVYWQSILILLLIRFMSRRQKS